MLRKPERRKLLVEALNGDKTVSLLRNSWANIELGSGDALRSFRIIGIESTDDWWSPRANEIARKVMERVAEESEVDFTIVASHHPEAFEFSPEFQIDLTTAGHTHGGQLAVPFTGRILNVGRLVTPYLWGLYAYLSVAALLFFRLVQSLLTGKNE